MRLRGVAFGALLALAAVAIVWGSGIVEPPERLTSGIAALYAVFPDPVASAEVERLACDLPRLRLYVVCTEACDGTHVVIGVRGLSARVIANFNRIPSEPPEMSRDRFNAAVEGEGLRLDAEGARAVIGCALAVEGLRPDLIVTDPVVESLRDAAGDEEALRALAASLEDPRALDRIAIGDDPDGYAGRFFYWATSRPGRPVVEVTYRLAPDGRILATTARDVLTTDDTAYGNTRDIPPT